MANDFEKAIEEAKYSALPLPRSKSDPTTIFQFTDGHLTIVRNPHSCLPDPPIAVTEDPSVSLLTFSRTFNFELKGIVGFVAKIFGLGSAKADLDVKSVRKATVELGGLSHHTIETGVLMEYLADQKLSTTCMHDILDKDHFTVVAALKANTFTYQFSNSTGVVVNFTGPEAKGLFQASANVDVQVGSDGKIVVTSPTYIGYVAWDGNRIAKELQKAKAPARLGIGAAKKPVTILQPFVNASPSTIRLVESALTPDELRRRRLTSMGIRHAA
jgi:hypothetical protein